MNCASPRILAVLLTPFVFHLLHFGQSPIEGTPKSLIEQYDRAIQAGESQWKQGHYSDSLVFLNEALVFAKKMKDITKEVRCSMDIGKLCWTSGQIDDSQKYYSDALLVAKTFKLKSEMDESRIALRISKLYSQGKEDCLAGQFEKSIVNFNLAIELAQKLKSEEHEIRCLRQLGLTYLVKRDLENYFSANKRILQLSEGADYRREQIGSLNNIGYYYLESGDYSKALNYYSDALDRSRNNMNKEDESLCLKNISLIMVRLGFYERALDYLTAANAIDRRLGNAALSPQSLNDLGASYQNKGFIFSDNSSLYQALEYFNEALDLTTRTGDHVTELQVLNNTGYTYLHLGKYHTAKSHFRSAFQIAERIHENEALIEISNNLGICNLKMGNYDRAQAHFLKTLEYGDHIGVGHILWEPLFFLGQCYERAEAYEKAFAYYTKSIDAIDNIRSQILFDYYKVEFGKNKFKVYESVIDLLYLLYKKKSSLSAGEEIFKIVERAKARAFLETLGELKRDFRRRLDPGLAEKERELSGNIFTLTKEMSHGNLSRQKLGEMQKTLKQYEDEYLRLISRMRAETPEVADFVSPLPVCIKQIQEDLLDERTAVFEYFFGEKNSLLFFISKQDFAVFPLPPRSEIETSISAYLELLSNSPEGNWRGALAASRLSNELLFSAVQRLPGSIERLIIIPDGKLFCLPFESLPLGRADKSLEQAYLISKYVVSYGSSCSSLLVLKESKKRDQFLKSLLAFGNPSFPSNGSSRRQNGPGIVNIMKEVYEGQGHNLASLGQSGKEIKEISGFFSKDNRSLFLNTEASEEVIKRIHLEDYEIIHFACHAILDEKIPFRSALVLAPAEKAGEDGLLQAREIANLRLAAELVVLSACETNKGHIEKGEGMFGLTRTFFFSGARSVVSTLWKISDDATAKFMDHFYDFLSKKNDKAQALRLTKLRMLESKYSHPFYWAAFVLHGEPSSTLNVH